MGAARFSCCMDQDLKSGRQTVEITPAVLRAASSRAGKNACRSASTARSLRLFDELNVTVIAQEAEIAHEIKICRPQFHSCQMDDFGETALSVAPVEGRNGEQVPGARGIALPLVVRKIVQWNGAESLALNDDAGCHRSFVIRGRLRQARRSRLRGHGTPNS